jgi:CRISPR-associated protein Cas2
VARLIATRQIRPADFDRTAEGGCRMTKPALTAFLDAYERRLLTWSPTDARRRGSPTAWRSSRRPGRSRTGCSAASPSTRRSPGARTEDDIYTLLVCYDIADDERRGDISALLSTCGARVQLSIFECTVRTKREISALRAALRRAIDQDEDQVRIYRLDKTAIDNRTILGRRRLEERADFYIV